MKALAAEGLDLLAEDCRTPESWEARIARDQRHARTLQPPAMRQATTMVLSRAIASGAEAVALTGSTARGCRTTISDLDFHLVGARPTLTDVPVDVDVYATNAATLLERLRAGDDYVQWTLRFGCVLHDTGVLWDAAAELVRTGLWPSPERKLEQARRMLDLAQLILVSGDRDAAHEQVRGALTAVARGVLLKAGVFPLSRKELTTQLRALRVDGVAAALDRCIYAEPSIAELSAGAELACGALNGVPRALAAR